MEDMGKQMIKDCGGLPLAVKVLGGLLATQPTLSEWKRVCENIRSRTIRGRTSISSLNHILSLSYEGLPMYLKHCFLYFAHFPEDYTIYVDHLAYCWASEGIPRLRYYGEVNIREVAYGYIEELVKRNLVISKRDVVTSRFETCQMHDIMREVCLLKAEEENFLQIVDATTTSQSPCKSRRIAVHQLDDETCHPKWAMQNPKLRSLLFYKKQRVKLMPSRLSFSRVKLIRALHLSHVKFEKGKLPSSIGELIHLRYLSLDSSEVSCLPCSMRNLKLLFYLNLDVDASSPLYMGPNILKEMREMEFLCLPRNIHNKIKLELANLVNLETLYNFSTEHSSVRDLNRMTQLERLSIAFNGKGCITETLSSSLSELRHLKYLAIDGRTYDGKAGFDLDCGIHLRQLILNIFMSKLPDEQHLPSCLTYLYLEKCCLVEDPMPILEKLLHLKYVDLLDQSFVGRRMVCSDGGFPQLQNLFIWGLKEWEEWIVEEGSMPLLRTLTIKDCPMLKELPQELQFLYSLKKLIMDEEWKEKVLEGGEEYYKVQRIPLVQFY